MLGFLFIEIVVTVLSILCLRRLR